MDIFNKAGLKVSIEDKKLFEFIRSFSKEKQVDIMFDILEYDNGEILKLLGKKKYNACVENYEKFISISKDEVICKKIGVDEFDQNLSDAYLNVANKYKAEGEIWKQFLK